MHIPSYIHFLNEYFKKIQYASVQIFFSSKWMVAQSQLRLLYAEAMGQCVLHKNSCSVVQLCSP